MKKLLTVLALTISAASFSAGTAEVRLGLDINPKFESGDSKIEDVKTSWELAAEYTVPVWENFELGGGLAYQNHGKITFANSDVSSEIYDSVPLYVTAKYKSLPINQSLNHMRKQT